jgi:translation initiation factor IF-2
MLKEGLGPNGAIIRSIDILSENYEYLGKNLMNINSNSDLMIVDTPGQLEILMFRSSGLKLIDIIKEVSKPVGVFLLDPTLGLRGNSAAIVTLTAIVIRLGLGIPTLPVLSKADLINVKSVIYSPSYYTEVEQILNELRSEGEILTDMLVEVLNIVKKYLRPERLLAVSALNGYGIEDLYKAIHEIFCTCGDLT